MNCYLHLKLLAVAAAFLAGPAMAQDTDFDPATSAQCVQNASEFSDKRLCIGKSADVCMGGDGGSTTVGMGYCLQSEAEYWDGRLNDAYKPLMASEKANDAEMAEIGATVPKTAEALRDMQRAWIAYRDAACLYEYAQWGGGTGGGPASAGCIMQLTGEQALKLEARLVGR